MILEEKNEKTDKVTDSVTVSCDMESHFNREMATPEVDPNDVVPDQQVIRCRTFLDDMVIEGPYHPVSTSDTLVDIPPNLPHLESPKPILVPAVRHQHAV